MIKFQTRNHIRGTSMIEHNIHVIPFPSDTQISKGCWSPHNEILADLRGTIGDIVHAEKKVWRPNTLYCRGKLPTLSFRAESLEHAIKGFEAAGFEVAAYIHTDLGLIQLEASIHRRAKTNASDAAFDRSAAEGFLKESTKTAYPDGDMWRQKPSPDTRGHLTMKVRHRGEPAAPTAERG